MLFLPVCLFLLTICRGAAQYPGPGHGVPVSLPALPTSYMASLMMNIEHGSVQDDQVPGRTVSIWESADFKVGKARITSVSEQMFPLPGNQTTFVLLEDIMIWNPELSGIDSFLSISMADMDGEIGIFCEADRIKPGTFMDWMFGFDPSNPEHELPSISGMIHSNTNYTAGPDAIVRGINVKSYVGFWEIPAWKANMSVIYYWTDPERWGSSSGLGKSVPVTAVMEGTATISDITDNLKIQIDYTDFFEVAFPDEAFDPPSDMWCENRDMKDTLPKISDQFSFTGELIISVYIESKLQRLVIPRREWYSPNNMLSRVDYTPLRLNISDPLNPMEGHVSELTEINDFNTGLAYIINKDLGNCTIEPLTDTQSADVLVENGRVRMRNPFFLLTNGATFAYNGKVPDRGIQIDGFVHTEPVGGQIAPNETITTAFYLSNSQYEIQDGSLPERMVPAKMVAYLTSMYNQPQYKVMANIFHFSKRPQDMDLYDISTCFEDSHKLHLMIRMGWRQDMDIQGSLTHFRDTVRQVVVTWGRVTPVRVTNIEYDIDAAHSAFYLIFSVVGYPPNTPVELNNKQDAIRPISEVKTNIVTAVDKTWFKVEVYTNSTDGAKVVSIAEPGSVIELGKRDGHYNHRVGYTSGAMAALGILLLIMTVCGVLGLLVYILKW